MRVALLSTIDSVADAGGDPRGFLIIAGRTLARHQLDCALALGCEKIACQGIGFPQELLDLQHQAEKSGAQFQVISGPRALSGMITAADELLVFADGLLPDQALAGKLLADRPAVLVLPAGDGVAEGFERIDRDHAWAGVMIVRGPAVERLTDLPPDADPVAGLLRIALQTGTRMVSMPQDILSDRRWGLVRSRGDAAQLEQAWINRHVRPIPYAAPFLAAADRLATALMIRSSERQKFGSGAILGGSAAVVVAAGFAGWLWQPAAGLALMAGAYFLARTGGALRAMEGPLLDRPPLDRLGHDFLPGFGRIGWWLRAAWDGVVVALAGLTTPPDERLSAVLGVVSLLLAFRLGEALPLRNWKMLLADRTLLAIILTAAAYSGQIIHITQLLAISTLAATLLDISRPQLTRT